MAKKTYYGVYQRGKLVETKDKVGRKMPLIYLSKKSAEDAAEIRRLDLRKPNKAKPITI